MHLEDGEDTIWSWTPLLSALPARAPQAFPDTFFLRSREFRRLMFKETADAAKDLRIHGWRDAAGLGILLARMVDAEQSGRARRDFGLRAMGEFVKRTGGYHAALL
jgi:hypothetical protein